jgi:threonine/homoserine/homoserine lactone efflux protein
MDPSEILNHQFTVAAYVITWAIQLGYLAWLALKWRAQKREAARSTRNPR